MTAYRQQAVDRTILFCPRCNELLDPVDFGVDTCPRCEGFWIGNSVLDLSGRKWPAGPQAWWRNALRCPVCQAQGIATTMNARTSNEVIVDQCFAHGVWLDRGELSRVMRDPAVEELSKLREHLAALEPSPEQLLERRERWQGEQEERARLAEIERRRIESERAKRAAEDAKTEAQRIEDHRKASGDKLREAERLAQARRDAEKQANEKRADWQRIQAELRIHEDRAAIAAAERARKGTDVEDKGAAEQERAFALAKQRADEAARRRDDELQRQQRLAQERQQAGRGVELALETATERVDWLVARVESLEHELATTRAKLVKARGDLVDAAKAVDEHRARTAIE